MNNSSDSFEVLDLTADEIEKARTAEIQAMKGPFSASVMTQIFEKSYPKLVNLPQAIYSTKHAIIFSPSSDKSKTDLPTVETLLCSASQKISKNDISSKILLFPITEQQLTIDFYVWNSGPRNHWVTLHYDPSTEIATIIDSRPYLNSFLYPLSYLEDFLKKGLRPFQCSVKDFRVIYQDIQPDDIYCGPWTAINIESLAYGATISSLSKTFTNAYIDSIVQHHIDKVFYDKKFGLRTDLIYSSFFDEVKMTLSDIQPIIRKILANTNDATITQLINHRENIIFKEKPLSISNPLLPCDLKNAIKDLQRDYRLISKNQVIKLSSKAHGYSIKDPDRLFNNLINIGFDEKEITQFSFIEVLFYDAVIFFVTSEVEAQIQTQIDGILSKIPMEHQLTFAAAEEHLNQLNFNIKKNILSIIKNNISEHHQHQIDQRKDQTLPINSFLLEKREYKKFKPLCHKPERISKYSFLQKSDAKKIILTYRANGYYQFIHLNAYLLSKTPLQIHKILNLMKTSGWDFSKIEITFHATHYTHQLNKSLSLTWKNIPLLEPSTDPILAIEDNVRDMMETSNLHLSEEFTHQTTPNNYQSASFWKQSYDLLRAILNFLCKIWISISENIFACIPTFEKKSPHFF